MLTPFKLLIFCGLFSSALTLSPKAFAVLGESYQSLENDQIRISNQSTVKVQTSEVHNSLFTVHQIKKDGLTLNQYVDASGKIFAVTWLGQFHPDLTEILGPYIQDYQKALSAKTRMKGSHRIGNFQNNNLRVDRQGAMGKAQGRAVLMDSLPIGVTLDQIQ